MRRIFLAVLVTALLVPAEALAGPYLGRTRAYSEARHLAADVGEYFYDDTDWATDWAWWVEGPWNAHRVTRSKIVFDAQYTLYDDYDDYQESCDYKIVVWRYRDGPYLELVTDAYIAPNWPADGDCYESVPT